MKKVVSILLTIALIASLSIAAFAAGEKGAISVTTAEANPGETVTLAVAIDTNPGVAALQIKVKYDETALTLNGMTSTGMAGNWTIVKYAVWDNTADSTYTGKILALEFAVSDNAEAGKSYPVTVEVAAVNYNEEDVEFTVAAGAIEIAKAEEPTEPSVPSEPTEPSEPSEPTEHEHVWGAYEHDADYHWRVCEGCDELSEREAHKFNGEGYCICGYKDPDFDNIDDEPDTGDITSVIACAVLAAASVTGTGITVIKRKK